MTVHEALLDDDTCNGSGAGNAIHIAGIERQRLFAQYVLPRGDRRERPRDVLGVGQWDVDRVDARIIEQRLVAGDGARHGPRTRVGVRAREVAAGHRHQLAAAGQAHGRDYAAIDARRPENAPTESPHSAVVS